MAGNGMSLMIMMPEPFEANVPMLTAELTDGDATPLVNPVAVHTIF